VHRVFRPSRIRGTYVSTADVLKTRFYRCIFILVVFSLKKKKKNTLEPRRR